MWFVMLFSLQAINCNCFFAVEPSECRCYLASTLSMFFISFHFHQSFSVCIRKNKTQSCPLCLSLHSPVDAFKNERNNNVLIECS